MKKKLIISPQLLRVTLTRLCQQLFENHNNFSKTAVIGLQPRGVNLAYWIHQELEKISQWKIDMGYLDPTFHRDDFRRRKEPVHANETKIPFSIEGKNVLLIDDVLFTGRTVRAAMDAMIAFGRPSQIELLVLIDRKHSRDLPISANYVGKHVDTIVSQKVLVELQKDNPDNNKVWLINTSSKEELCQN